jgi:hypothetical protein
MVLVLFQLLMKNLVTSCPLSPKTLSMMLITTHGLSTKVPTLHTMTVKEMPKCVVVVVNSDKVPLV